MPEIQGKAHGKETLWALVFAGRYPVRAGQQVKIVFRMTGEVAMSMAAAGPGGQVVEAEWGPEGHLAGSNWTRPGLEWGSGWRFPAPGCWRIQIGPAGELGTVGILVR